MCWFILSLRIKTPQEQVHHINTVFALAVGWQAKGPLERLQRRKQGQNHRVPWALLLAKGEMLSRRPLLLRIHFIWGSLSWYEKKTGMKVQGRKKAWSHHCWTLELFSFHPRGPSLALYHQFHFVTPKQLDNFNKEKRSDLRLFFWYHRTYPKGQWIF